MKIGSLFSGIGGLELGLERADVGRTVWQVEKDPYCRRVLARHWPDAVRYEDVTTVDWAQVEPVEVMCGGFPCQDVSNAGKRAGLAGDRSGLWSEYVRAVRHVRPSVVVVENVAALLAIDGGRGFGRVLGDLAESGYDCEWDCIPAAAVGAPHRRDRVFILAHLAIADPRRRRSPRTDDPQEGVDVVAEPAGQHPSDVADASGRASGAGGEGLRGEGDRDLPCEAGGRWTRGPGGGGGSSDGGHWPAEPDVGRVADGVPSRVDRLRGLGNAVVPQVAEVVGRRVVELLESPR